MQKRFSEFIKSDNWRHGLSSSDKLSAIRGRLWCIATLCIVSTAQGANITVGSHVLLANTPNQIITIQVTDAEQIAGEDFFAQIGDGGVLNGGRNTNPIFTNVDIINGTIFASSNNGAFGDPNGTNPPGSNAAHPLIWVD